MKVFICGGGADEQTAKVNKLYADIIDTNRPVLYIPIAMENQMFDGCFSWIKDELAPYGIDKIEMLTDVYDFPDALSKYSSIYIGGGNTYRLLTLLKQSRAFEKTKKYIAEDGIIMGGSAGAIIFGRDIRCTDYADENITGLSDTCGFNILNGYDICCHYTNRDKDRNAYEYNVILDYSQKGNKVLALPEETHLLVEDDKFTVIGNKDCTLFDCGVVKNISPNQIFLF